MPGAGSIYRLANGEFLATIHDGDAPGLAAAKAACVAGGLIQMGPGTDAIGLGTGWGGVVPAAGIVLAQVKSVGGLYLSRLHVVDGVDPTKAFGLDISAVTTGIERTLQFPNWSGILPLPIDFGTSGQFLRSNGSALQPSWAGITNALLDGSNHTDTAAGSVNRGDLIVGNATPRWARLPIGSSGRVLISDGIDATWGVSPTAVEHNALFHLKPFSATSVSMTNGSTTLTTTGGQFSNVRVGDRINLDTTNYHTSLYGFRVTALIDTNNVTMDRSNGSGGNISGATATIFPGDHFDNTLLGGLLPTGGWGTFDGGASGGGTMPTIRGSAQYRGYADGATPVWDYLGSTSTSTPWGFCISKFGTTNKAFFHVNDLTGNATFKLPNLAGNDTVLVANFAQSINGKNFQINNVIECQNVVSAGSGTVFSDDADNTKQLLFDCSGIATGAINGKIAKWQDLSAQGHVDYTYVSRTTGIDAKATGTTNLFTVPTGKTFITTRVVVRCTAATAITVGPSYGIGVAAGEDDIVASAAHTTFTATDTFVLQNPKDPAVVASSTQIIKIGIDTAATGTSMTLAVDLAGYLI